MDDAITELKSQLKFSNFQSSSYSRNRKYLAEICLRNNKEMESIYNLTESQGVNLRKKCITIFPETSKYNKIHKYLSFKSIYARDETIGMLQRLSEMPKEWTIVQLSLPNESNQLFSGEKSDILPELKTINITRLPCGPNLKVDCPVTVQCEWPKDKGDLLECFFEMKLKLECTDFKTFEKKSEFKMELAKFVEKVCEKLSDTCLKEWFILFFGTICNENLSKYIRAQINEVLNLAKAHGGKFARRERYLTYVIAEAIIDMEKKYDYLNQVLSELFPDDTKTSTLIITKIEQMKAYAGNLKHMKRNPVILILEGYLDLIPWENLAPFQKHPFCRMPSIHFVHALFRVNRHHIKSGLREVDGKKTSIQYLLATKNNLQESTPPELVTQTLNTDYSDFEIPDRRLLNVQNSDHNNLDSLLFSYSLEDAEKVSNCGMCNLREDVEGEEIDDEEDNYEELNVVFMRFLFGHTPWALDTLWPVSPNDSNIIKQKLEDILFDKEITDIRTFIKFQSIKRQPNVLRALIEAKKELRWIVSSAAFVVRGIPSASL